MGRNLGFSYTQICEFPSIKHDGSYSFFFTIFHLMSLLSLVVCFLLFVFFLLLFLLILLSLNNLISFTDGSSGRTVEVVAAAAATDCWMSFPMDDEGKCFKLCWSIHSKMLMFSPFPPKMFQKLLKLLKTSDAKLCENVAACWQVGSWCCARWCDGGVSTAKWSVVRVNTLKNCKYKYYRRGSTIKPYKCFKV